MKILVTWILGVVELVFLVPFRRIAEIHNVGFKYGMLYYNLKKNYCKGGILSNNRGVRGLFRILILWVLSVNRIFQLQS